MRRLVLVLALFVSPASAQDRPGSAEAVVAAFPETQLTAGDGGSDDHFGFSTSLSGDRALVGAPTHFPLTGQPLGAAYVYVLDGTTWRQEAKLVASDGSDWNSFGYSVSLSGDRALVGSRFDRNASGSAYVFVRDGSTWRLETKLFADDGESPDQFGTSVSLSGDRALIGAPYDGGSGSAYVFVLDGDAWIQEAKLTPSGGSADRMGHSVALLGARAIVGDPYDDAQGPFSGAAYVFERGGAGWTREAKLVAADGGAESYLGLSVALSSDRALLGAYTDDVNAPSDGAAYVFVRDGAGWRQEAKLVSENSTPFDGFGTSVALSDDRALVGAFGDGNKGAAYAFVQDSGTDWRFDTKLTATNDGFGDRFGHSVALSGGRALVGAYQDDARGLDSGSAVVFATTNPVSADDDRERPHLLSAVLPNPSAARASLVLSLAAPERVYATLVDALGRELAVLLDGRVSGGAKISVDTSQLAPGVYAVRVEGETFAETQRLTVVR